MDDLTEIVDGGLTAACIAARELLQDRYYWPARVRISTWSPRPYTRRVRSTRGGPSVSGEVVVGPPLTRR